ncbi:MAG: hypothetical protein FWF97_04695 [Alphaproteobacteria bacterium]|nr:hypothetical protein [Alphaproteobacteria bacterium]
MTERNRQPSAAALERIARLRAEVNRQADAFKNPETFMPALEEALSDDRIGGLAILEYNQKTATYYVGFAHFKRLAIQETRAGYFCGLQEFSADRNSPIESIEIDSYTSLSAFYATESKYRERNNPRLQMLLRQGRE